MSAKVPLPARRETIVNVLPATSAGVPFRTDSWDSVRRVVTDLVQAVRANGTNLLDRAEQILLREIIGRCSDVATGAALLGVSPPTYRRRVAHLQSCLEPQTVLS